MSWWLTYLMCEITLYTIHLGQWSWTVELTAVCQRVCSRARIYSVWHLTYPATADGAHETRLVKPREAVAPANQGAARRTTGQSTHDTSPRRTARGSRGESQLLEFLEFESSFIVGVGVPPTLHAGIPRRFTLRRVFCYNIINNMKYT